MYPGFILNIATVRDPFSKIVKHLYPCVILNICVICVFQLNAHKIADRVTNIGFLLFSFVVIIKNMKGSIPEVPMMTYADKYLYLQLIGTLLPIVSTIVYNYGDEKHQ